ncbi:MAG: glycosyltransferase [Cyanobacteria bacterium P01_F01_bin.86]
MLHVGKYFPPFRGGIERVMSDLMQQQKRMGLEVFALVHHHEPRQEATFEDLPEGRICRVPIVGSVIYVPIALRFPIYLARMLKDHNPSVLHMHMPNVSCFWALFSARARKVPWVIHWHSDVLGAKPDKRVKALYPFYWLFEKALLKNAKSVIVTSPPYLESSHPLKQFRDKCRVVPLGIENASIETQEHTSEGKQEILNILCIGRLTYYKGHQILLKALSLLKQSKKQFSLKIVGDGELRTSLEGLTAELQLEQHVSFKGAVSDAQLQALFQQTDLLCLPSIERTEAFGVVLLEAMQAEKPCVVTDVEGSGMNWVVKDGETGFVVEASSPVDLMRTLGMAVENKTLLQEMGKAGKHRFLKQFTIEHVAKQIHEIYASLLENNLVE